MRDLERLHAATVRTLLCALAVIGACYAFVGANVLIHLGDVTRRWTQLSGDPDFPADATRFSLVIVVILWWAAPLKPAITAHPFGPTSGARNSGH
jgi:hypothetical protein